MMDLLHNNYFKNNYFKTVQRMGWYKILKKTVYEKNGNINKKTENLKIYQNLILSLKSANKIKMY